MKRDKDDQVCPKCGKLVKGAASLVSVAVFIHRETPGACQPKGKG